MESELGSEPPLVLDAADVARHLPMRDALPLMVEALSRYSSGATVTPLRSIVRLEGGQGVLALMPSHVKDRAIGVKVVTALAAGRQGAGHAPLQATILLLAPYSGRPLALVDGPSVTALRTAAASAVATDALARRTASTLAILGCGAQAEKHLEALRLVREFRVIRVFSPTREHRQRFAARARESLSGPRMTIVASESAEEAVRGADVVCTVTNAREPVLRRDWLAPGAHVNAVGASLRPFRELDSATVRDARVFVDSRESAASEAGDLLIPQAEGVISTDHVVGEIGDLLLRKVEGRRDDQELTLFKSLGIAVQDILAAAHVYRRALVSDRVSRSGGLPSSHSASLASLDEV